jgi:imidazolonepropionase-like amidohydrolase
MKPQISPHFAVARAATVRPVGGCWQAAPGGTARHVLARLSSPASRLLQRAWLAAITVGISASASTIVPAQRPAAPVLLRGGTVHTVSGGVLEKTDVLMADGKIAAIGPKLTAPRGAEVVDVSGRHVYPGFISANSQLGLTEVQAVRATVDVNEIGEVNPNARAQVAINPESDLIPVARLNGVLTANITPLASAPGGGFGAAARAAIFAGTSALVRLDGWTWEDMTLRPATAVHLYWPAMEIPRDPRNPRAAEEARRTRDDRLKLIRDTLAAARAYAGAKQAGRADTDLRLEALLPVLRGETRLFVHATSINQINAALDWARDEKLAITLVGGRDAWMVADRLKAANVGVILAGTFNVPARRDESYDLSYAIPGKLHAAGVKFCIALGNDGASETGNERNLPYEAALAAGFGLSREEALKSVTLFAAELLGVEKELGSLEVGKRATLFVSDGDALEITSNVQLAYIDGAKIELRSRHTDLHEKYRKRLGQ